MGRHRAIELSVATLWSLTERQVRFDSRFVGFVDDGHLAEVSFALRALARQQMAAGGLRTQNLAASGDFEPFCDGFACLAPSD
jgi:hypothetical protein